MHLRRDGVQVGLRTVRVEAMPRRLERIDAVARRGHLGENSLGHVGVACSLAQRVAHLGRGRPRTGVVDRVDLGLAKPIERLVLRLVPEVGQLQCRLVDGRVKRARNRDAARNMGVHLTDGVLEVREPQLQDTLVIAHVLTFHARRWSPFKRGDKRILVARSARGLGGQEGEHRLWVKRHDCLTISVEFLNG
jgi:hypothetical protein